MKKRLLLYCLIIGTAAQAQETPYNHMFFVNSIMEGNYFYSKTKYQSPSWIKNIQQKLPVSNNIFFTPGNSLQLQYINGNKGKWSAQIYQNKMRGQDITKQSQWLSFHINIVSSKTIAKQLPAIQLLNKDSNTSMLLSMSDYLTSAKINQWHRIRIPLKAFTGLTYANSSDITGIFFTQNSNDNSQHEIFIDDVELLPDTTARPIIALPVITSCKGFAKHVDIEWKTVSDTSIKWVKIYRSSDEKNFVPAGIQSPVIYRYADYTSETGKNYQYKISFVNRNYVETKPSPVVSVSTKT